MGRLRRSRMHKNVKDNHKKYIKSKRKTKDLDQIHEDFEAENLAKIMKPEIDGDLPGLGQFYCIHCSKHYIDQTALIDHMRSKVHKRRLKQLKEAPYTQAEADAAGGRGQYKAPDAPYIPTNIAVGADVTTTVNLDAMDDAAEPEIKPLP